MEHSPSWKANKSSTSQDIPALYITRKFIIAFTEAHHLSLSWNKTIQSISPSHYFKTNFNIILPSKPRSSKYFFPSGFPTKTLYAPHLSSPPYMLHAPPISLFLIRLPEQYLARSTDHKIPRYVVFSTPLLPRPS